MGLFAWNFFGAGGRAQYFLPERTSFEEALKAYRTLLFSLDSRISLSGPQIEMARKIWSRGFRKARDSSGFSRRSVKSLRSHSAGKNDSPVWGVNVSNLGRANIAFLARTLALLQGLEPKERPVLLLLTQAKKLDWTILSKKLLEQEGVSPEKLREVITGNRKGKGNRIKNYGISGKELRKKAEGNTFKLDPDLLYFLVLEKYNRVMDLKLDSISLNIFTQEMIFEESWTDQGIRLFRIDSKTEVVEILPDTETAFRENAIAAMQQ